MRLHYAISVFALGLPTICLPALGRINQAQLGFGYSGAPGDDNCSVCHTGGLNASKGSVSIAIPKASYVGGETIRLTITISDPDARRWGFQLTARRAANTNSGAGTFATADGNTLVLPNSGSQYIAHSTNGTRPGTAGPVSFDVDWTAPAAGSGGAIFYVAANAANNNNQDGPGDFVYTASKQLEEGAATSTPTLRADQPVLPAFGGNLAIGFASNGYLELYGTNLSNTTRQWAGSDFQGSKAPTSLDGVSVKVNGKDAAVYYISPTQININTPDDAATGPVVIHVSNNGQSSNAATVQKSKVAPSMLTTPAFLIGGKQYVAALMPDLKTFVGTPGLISGVGFQAVKPGDNIVIYALGCGPTSPATQGGVVTATTSNVSSSYELRIGGQKANVTFFGAIQGAIGLYQINAVVPNVGVGDQAIELIVDGVSNSQDLVLSGIQN